MFQIEKAIEDCPLISVVMPTYNNDKYIKDAVNSIYLQTYTNWELIIVNDCSEDKTSEILKNFADPRIKVLNNEQRLGVAMSINIGIANSKGGYIARMDSDDISFPDRLQKQFDFLQKNPDIDLLGSSVVCIDNSSESFAKLKYPSDHHDLINNLQRGIVFCHPTWFMKREWITNWPYEKLIFKYGAEDLTFLLKMMTTSCYACLEEPLLAYRVSPSTKKYLINNILLILLLYRYKYWAGILFSIVRFISGSLVFLLSNIFSEKIFYSVKKIQYNKITDQEKKNWKALQYLLKRPAISLRHKPQLNEMPA